MNQTEFEDKHVRCFFRLVQQGDPETVIELRALNYSGRKNNIFSGYFDQEEPFVEAAKLASLNGSGVYCTINVCNPQILARCANRAQEFAEITTSDRDIVRRRYIPIDLDPVRPAGTSSSDEQHEAAIQRGYEVYHFIKDNQWKEEPIMVDSGNGSHLLIPYDCDNNEETKQFTIGLLNALAQRFNDSQIKVDESVFNAARIMRLPGTMNRKGDNLTKYPHRLCKILHVPDGLQIYI